MNMTVEQGRCKDKAIGPQGKGMNRRFWISDADSKLSPTLRETAGDLTAVDCHLHRDEGSTDRSWQQVAARISMVEGEGGGIGRRLGGTIRVTDAIS